MNLRPADFWALSPAEWRWLAGAAETAAPTRADIDALVRLHPDERASSFSPAESSAAGEDPPRSRS